MRRYFSLSEYEARWQRAEALMRARGFEVALVVGRGGGTTDNCGDILYLTNHYSVSGGTDSLIWSARSFSGVILQLGTEPELHIDEPEGREDRLALPLSRVQCHSHPFAGMAAALNARGIRGRVAICGTWFLPVKYWNELVRLTPQIEWVECDDLIRELRRIKSPAELACYREAGEVATAATTALMEGLLAGQTEREAAAEAARITVAGGGRLQAIGANHGDTLQFDYRNPLCGASEDAPAPGDMVRGTVHAAFREGYYLDPGRTAVRGTASADQRRLIEATSGIVTSLCAMMRPGVRLLDVAAEGDRLTTAFGGDVSAIMKNFPFFGHGIGLSFEQPRISTAMSLPGDVLEENMVMGVEAFLSLDGVGSAFFEDIIIINRDGAELLTRTPHFFW